MKNPQSNTICEHIYQTVANVIQVIMKTTTIAAFQQDEQVMDNVLATTMHVT